MRTVGRSGSFPTMEASDRQKRSTEPGVEMSNQLVHRDVPETVSSSSTFFYKFVFTTIWSGGFGIGTILMFVSRHPQPDGMRLVFATIWLVGSFFLWEICGRLKRVRIDGTTILISNYRNEIAVSADEIAAVKQNRLINLRPVILTFKNETRFGRTVIFMPRRSFHIFSEDEIVERLRRAGHLQSGRSQ